MNRVGRGGFGMFDRECIHSSRGRRLMEMESLIAIVVFVVFVLVMLYLSRDHQAKQTRH